MAALSVPHACRRLLGCEMSTTGVLKGGLKWGATARNYPSPKQTASRGLYRQPGLQLVVIYRSNQKFNAKSIFDMAFTLTALRLPPAPCALRLLLFIALKSFIIKNFVHFLFCFCFFCFFFSFFFYTIYIRQRLLLQLCCGCRGASRGEHSVAAGELLAVGEM